MEEAQDGDITVVAGVRCDAWFGSVKAATVLCQKGYKASTCTLIVIVIGGLKSMGLTNHHQDKELQHVVPNYHGLSMFRDGHNIQVSQLMLEVTLFRVTFHIN